MFLYHFFFNLMTKILTNVLVDSGTSSWRNRTIVRQFTKHLITLKTVLLKNVADKINIKNKNQYSNLKAKKIIIKNQN